MDNQLASPPKIDSFNIDDYFQETNQNENIKLTKFEIQKVIEKLFDSNMGTRDKASKLLIKNDNPITSKMVLPLISSQDISIRNLAGEILLRRGEASVYALIDSLKGANDDDQKFAIDILGLIQTGRASESITKVMYQSKNDNVILACIEALGNIKDENAVEKLIEFYDRNELFQPSVIESLGKIGSLDAQKYIMKKFNQVDELTKFSMIESLGLLGNEETINFLLSNLEGLKGPLAWSTLTAIQKISDKINYKVPKNENIKKAAIETLKFADVLYKKAAVEIVTPTDDSEILEAMIKIYGENAQLDEMIKNNSIYNSNIVLPKIIRAIRRYSKNINLFLLTIQEIIQNDNGESLSTLSDNDFNLFIDVLIQNLNHAGEEVRKNCTAFLFYIAPEKAFENIDTMVQDGSAWNRLNLIDILENFDDPKALDVISSFVNDYDDDVRERAVESLNNRNN